MQPLQRNFAALSLDSSLAAPLKKDDKIAAESVSSVISPSNPARSPTRSPTPTPFDKKAVRFTPVSDSSESESDNESPLPDSSDDERSERATPVPGGAPLLRARTTPTGRLSITGKGIEVFSARPTVSRPSASRSPSPLAFATPTFKPQPLTQASVSSAFQTTVKKSDSRVERTPWPPLPDFKNNCELVNSYLKACEYDLSALDAKVRQAITDAASTIHTLRIEAYAVDRLPKDLKSLDVKLLDANGPTDALREPVEKGLLCTRPAIYIIRSLSQVFRMVRKIELYFANLDAIHFLALTLFPNLLDVEIRYSNLCQPKGFFHLKKLAFLKSVKPIDCLGVTEQTIECFKRLEMFLELKGNAKYINQLLKKSLYNVSSLPADIQKTVLDVAPTISELHLEGQFMVIHPISQALINVRQLDITRPLETWVDDKICTTKLRGSFPTGNMIQLSKDFPNCTQLRFDYAFSWHQHYDALTQFRKLNSLELNYCVLHDTEKLDHFAKLSDLRTLRFIFCEGMCDDALRALSSCTQLTHLTIHASTKKITTKGIQMLLLLNQLEELDLSHTPITDYELALIKKDFKKLRKLTLRYCPLITDKGVAQLRKMKDLSFDTNGCLKVALPDVDWMKQFQLQPAPQTSFDQFTEAQHQEFQKMVSDLQAKKI